MKLICKLEKEILPFDDDSDRRLGNYIYQQYLSNGNISLSSDYPSTSSTNTNTINSFPFYSSTDFPTMINPISNNNNKFTIDDNDRLTIPEPIEEAIKRGRNEADINDDSDDIIEESTDICDLDNYSPNKKRK